MSKKERGQFLWTALVAVVMGAIALQTILNPKSAGVNSLLSTSTTAQSSAAAALSGGETATIRSPAGLGPSGGTPF